MCGAGDANKNSSRILSEYRRDNKFKIAVDTYWGHGVMLDSLRMRAAAALPDHAAAEFDGESSSGFVLAAATRTAVAADNDTARC